MVDSKSAAIVGWVAGGSKVDATLAAVTRIGAAPDGDVVVPVPGVSRQHARIVRSGDEYAVEDAGSRFGTWVNGRRITRSALRHLDVITLGPDFDLVFLASRERQRPAIDPAATVTGEWIEGPAKGSTQRVQAGATLVIGRGAQCAISIDDAAVSRAHARLSFIDGRLLIEDLGSANGTFVSGQRLSVPVELQHRDEIDIAHVARLRIAVSEPERKAVREAPPESPEERAIAAVGVDWQTRMMGPADLLAFQPQFPTMPGLPTTPGRAAPVHVASPLAPPLAAPPAPPARPVAPASPATMIAGSSPLRAPAFDPAEAPGPAPPAASAASTMLGSSPFPQIPGALPPGVVSFHEAGGPASDDPTTPMEGATIATPQRAAASVNTLSGVRLSGDAGTYTLPIGRSTIGRAPEATIRIQSRTISRIHVAITVTADQAMVEDAGSANGTSVNDRPIDGPHTLADGDRIAAADVAFTVTLLRARRAIPSGS